MSLIDLRGRGSRSKLASSAGSRGRSMSLIDLRGRGSRSILASSIRGRSMSLMDLRGRGSRSKLASSLFIFGRSRVLKDLRGSRSLERSKLASSVGDESDCGACAAFFRPNPNFGRRLFRFELFSPLSTVARKICIDFREGEEGAGSGSTLSWCTNLPGTAPTPALCDPLYWDPCGIIGANETCCCCCC